MNSKLLLKDYRTWMFLIVLISTFLLVYSPHFSYKYPLHVDEWTHIGIAKENIKKGFVINNYVDSEVGYHIFLSGLFKILTSLGINPVTAYRFLPAIFACFASIILFYFVYKLTKSFFTAIFSMIFLASLPTDVNLMGLWFATPFTLCIPLIYLAVFLFVHGRFVWSAFLLLIICLIHPPSAVFLFPLLVAYLIIDYKNFKKKSLVVFAPYLVFSLFFFQIWWSGGFLKTLNLVLEIVKFEARAELLELSTTINPVVFNFSTHSVLINPYFLPILYGMVPFVLALIGIGFYFKDTKFKIFSVWFLIAALLLFLFNLVGISLFARRQHMVYYCMLSLIPFSALGLKKLIGSFKEIKIKEILKSGLIIVLILFVLITTFYNYGNQRQGTELYYLINDDDYQALLFLKNIDDPNKVIAPLDIATTIPAISEKPVAASTWPKKAEVYEEMVETFFSTQNCSKKVWTFTYFGTNYVFSHSQIKCGWEEIYNNKNYIYNVTDIRLGKR